MTHKEIRNIPKDRTVTYARMVVDYRPQKPDPNQVRIIARGKDWGNLAQGDEKKPAGTDSLFVMTHKEIHNITKDWTVTYVRMVVDYRPQKPDPKRFCITAGGDLIKYPGELTTRTADLTTSKYCGTVC